MRIVEVNPFFHPYDGGIEKRMRCTSRLFAERGHDVTVVTGRLSRDDPEEERMDGFRVIRLKSTLLRLYNPPYISSSGILDALEALDADIVDYHYRWAPSYNRALAAYRGPKLFTYHNMWGEGDGAVGYASERSDRAFAGKVLSSFDHIVAVSDYVRDDLLRRGYAPGYVSAVPPGLSTVIDPGDGSGDYILSLGRLVRTKGLDVLMKAMRKVDRRLIVCGKGPDAGRLRRMARRYGIEDRVEFRGYVSEEERAELMGGCRFFVMPSLHESFGIAATELMARGRPIVCSDADGLPSTVGDAGYVVPKGDPDALAEAMNIMFEDRELCESKAAAALEVAGRYRWDILMPRLEEIYSGVASGRLSRADQSKR